MSDLESDQFSSKSYKPLHKPTPTKAMSEPTQKQKQLAEEILRKFGNPDYTEEELTEEIPIVAQILADAEAEEREVLRKLAEKLQQASGHSTPFTEIDYIANQIIELLK